MNGPMNGRSPIVDLHAGHQHRRILHGVMFMPAEAFADELERRFAQDHLRESILTAAFRMTGQITPGRRVHWHMCGGALATPDGEHVDLFRVIASVVVDPHGPDHLDARHTCRNAPTPGDGVL